MNYNTIKGYFPLYLAVILVLPLTSSAQINANLWNYDQSDEAVFDGRSPFLFQPAFSGVNQTIYENDSRFQEGEATGKIEPDIRKSTSLTAGYIADIFNIKSDEGNHRFRFDGETTGLMLSSKSSSLMLSYGVAKAEENEGDIRSITADLNLGGNITIFRKFLGLPIGSYIPIRVNLGYRNLELLDNPNPDLTSTANIGTGSLGGGLGAEIRIPSDLPLLNNLTAFANMITSVGGITDLTSVDNDTGSDGKALSGIRLTKRTDLNIEAKIERLLGGNTGITAGLTLRWLHWTEGEAENVGQLLDVISGERDDLKLRATQSFFRLGINW